MWYSLVLGELNLINFQHNFLLMFHILRWVIRRNSKATEIILLLEGYPVSISKWGTNTGSGSVKLSLRSCSLHIALPPDIVRLHFLLAFPSTFLEHTHNRAALSHGSLDIQGKGNKRKPHRTLACQSFSQFQHGLHLSKKYFFFPMSPAAFHSVRWICDVNLCALSVWHLKIKAEVLD